MGHGLNGARVALLEGRMSSELAGLVERHGGQPHCVPAVREVPVECGPQVTGFLDVLAVSREPIVVFMTGAGVRGLFAETEKLGRKAALTAALGRATIACRGPKPVAALKAFGLKPAVVSAEPHTSEALLQALDSVQVRDRVAAVVHHGERTFELGTALRSRGAKLKEICLYAWLFPEDKAPLKALVDEIIHGRVDAVAFTSQVQTRHLFDIAWELRQDRELAHALNRTVVTAAVGPTCAAALEKLGVTPKVMPEHPKMGHLVLALAGHMQARSTPAGLVRA